MESNLRRTWAEINLDNLRHNYRLLRGQIGSHCRFLGVVKADAYGHGAVQVARVLEALGAEYLAVSSLDEAMELRNHAISMPILLLGHTPADQVPQLIASKITQTVTCEAKAIEYSEQAVACGGNLKVHMKLDTGMSRLGFLCAGEHFSGGVDALERACRMPNLDVEGIFTHFSVSDEEDEENAAYTRSQFSLFLQVLEAAEARGLHFPICHCANSGAVASNPQMYLDMVRPGILLYGYGSQAKRLGMKPVMSLKTAVSTIKIYDANTDISYGRTFTTDGKTRMGVLPIGYADGFFRCLSNRCCVWTPDGAAPVRGRICMDMTMVDLTELPKVQVGDEIEIFGENNEIELLAEQAGTIPYELCCAVSKRVPRVFLENGVETERELRLLP